MVGGWPSLSRLSSSSKFQWLQQQLSKLCTAAQSTVVRRAVLLQFEVLSVVHSVQRTAGELFWGRALSGRESGLRLCLGSVPIQGSLLWHIQFCFRLKGSPAPFLYRCFWHIAPPFLWFSASPHFLFLLLYLFSFPPIRSFSLFLIILMGLKRYIRGDGMILILVKLPCLVYFWWKIMMAMVVISNFS